MENQPISTATADFSDEWVKLSRHVRHLADRLKSKTLGTHLATESTELAEEIATLCDHVEQLQHKSAPLAAVAESQVAENTQNGGPEENAEIQQEILKSHREIHEMRADPKDILKALFMWQDDPAERLKHQQASEEKSRD
jgi:uncharacterized protein with PhoU and TrkA domain